MFARSWAFYHRRRSTTICYEELFEQLGLVEAMGEWMLTYGGHRRGGTSVFFAALQEDVQL